MPGPILGLVMLGAVFVISGAIGMSLTGGVWAWALLVPGLAIWAAALLAAYVLSGAY